MVFALKPQIADNTYSSYNLDIIMFKTAFIVGCGGFLGTVTRYISSQLLHKYFLTNFPIGTLIVNLVGCFLIGVFFGLFEKGDLISSNTRLFLTVGFCGGFTTFSAFSNDSMNLIDEREFANLIIYTSTSVFAGLIMTYLGKNLVNYIWS